MGNPDINKIRRLISSCGELAEFVAKENKQGVREHTQLWYVRDDEDVDIVSALLWSIPEFFPVEVWRELLKETTVIKLYNRGFPKREEGDELQEIKNRSLLWL